MPCVLQLPPIHMWHDFSALIIFSWAQSMKLLIKQTITSSLLADEKTEETVFKQFAPCKVDIQL